MLIKNLKIMKRFAPYILFLAGFMFLGMICFDKDGIREVRELRKTLSNQEKINYSLIKEIRDYKKEIRGIQNSNRELEKVLRDEYAMGRNNEVVVIFKEQKKIKTKTK